MHHYPKRDNNKKSSRRQLLFSAFLANFFEFYDFSLFGVFAIPLSKAFFPGEELYSILKGLSIFGIAFFARPFGSFFFGYLGDVKGRRYSLMLSILLMGFSTFLIGCLPTYKEIGILAPSLLIICRLFQGFSLGGESSGSFVFLLEHIKDHRGLIGASVLASGTTGVIFATLLGVVFTKSNMPEWSWRIPFWIGLVMGIVGIYIRSSLDETSEFLNYSKNYTVSQQFKELLKYMKPCLCTIGIGGVNSVFVYTLAIYLNIYINQFADFSLSSSLFYSNIGLAMCLITVPFMGYVSDKVSYQKIMRTACLTGVIGAFLIPYFLNIHFFVMAAVLLALIIGAFNGPTPAFLNNLFPVNIRYTGISVGFSLGTAIFGAFCPLVYTFLTKYFNSVFVLTPCLILMSIIGFISVSIGLKQHNNKID